MASVVISRPATEAAAWRAMRTTLVGSTIPFSTGFVTLSGSVAPMQVNCASGSNAHGGAPCLEGLTAEPTLRCRRDEMATDVERVVDRSVCREEPLSRAG